MAASSSSSLPVGKVYFGKLKTLPRAEHCCDERGGFFLLLAGPLCLLPLFSLDRKRSLEITGKKLEQRFPLHISCVALRLRECIFLKKIKSLIFLFTAWEDEGKSCEWAFSLVHLLQAFFCTGKRCTKFLHFACYTREEGHLLWRSKLFFRRNRPFFAVQIVSLLGKILSWKKGRRKETLLLRFLRCLSAVVKKIVADHRMEDLRGRDEITVFQGGGGGSCARKKTQFGISRWRKI